MYVRSFVVVVVVVVVTSPSGNAYMGRQMHQRDDKFHQIHLVLIYIFDVNAVTEMTLIFCCPPWA